MLTKSFWFLIYFFAVVVDDCRFVGRVPKKLLLTCASDKVENHTKSILTMVNLLNWTVHKKKQKQKFLRIILFFSCIWCVFLFILCIPFLHSHWFLDESTFTYTCTCAQELFENIFARYELQKYWINSPKEKRKKKVKRCSSIKIKRGT